MNILQNRIETFKTSMVKWPHTGSQYNKIETFAKAGFYFVRRPKYPDSLRCFMCDIELSNWRPGQSPFSRHTQESPTCALQWLNYPDLNRKLLAVNKKDPATDPRGATMRTARLATFINHNFWPPNKDMLPKKKYPSGNKLADAGFIFSPTPTQASRIRCLYCRITIEEPSANENLLHKHQELSNGCEFFSLTPNMRATRSRRDTIDSTHSHDTFSTAQSHPMDIGTNTEQKKRKPSIKSNQPSSQDYKQSTDVKQKTKRQRTVKGKPEDSSIATVDSLIDAEPIKIVSRKKSTEASATAQSIASHKGGISKNRTGPADVWDIDHMFSLPPISRRSAVTFGKSTGRRTLTSAKISEAGVNIFANLKTPLIAKSVEDESKPITSPSNHTLATTTKLTDEVDTLVQYKKSSRREDEIPAQSRTAKKRSLSSSSNTPNTNKHLRLKVVVDTKAVSPQPTTEDIFADNVPVKRDKGKGRAVEHTITPSAPQRKKLSLSKSKNKKILSRSPTSDTMDHNDLPSSSSHHPQRSFVGSSTSAPEVEMVPVIKIKKYQMPEGFIVSSPLSSPRIPSAEDKADVAALADCSTVSKSPSPLHNSHDSPVLGEFLSPSPVLEEFGQPSIGELPCDDNYVYDEVDLNILEDAKRAEEMITNNQDPFASERQRSFSPIPLHVESEHCYDLSQDDIGSGLLNSPPRSAVANMSFMQSTPSTAGNNRGVSALELFGPNPLSPITHLPMPNNDRILQYTPAIEQSGRTRRIFEIDEEIRETAEIHQMATKPDVDKISAAGEIDPGVEDDHAEVVASPARESSNAMKDLAGAVNDKTRTDGMLGRIKGITATTSHYLWKQANSVLDKLDEFEEHMRRRYHDLGIDDV